MMTEEQINQLRVLARRGQVYWLDAGGDFHEIIAVPFCKVDVEDDGMPVPVAYLRKGYIDLENVEPQSLVEMKPLFPATDTSEDT